MALNGLLSGWAFLVGRVLFGGVLAFMGLNHFQQPEGLAGYAESKGVPAPTLAVYGSGALLVLGGLSLAAGVYPVVGALAVAAFFVVTTPWIHDFWNVEDPDQRQQQMTQFLKNAALLGGALVLFALTAADWPFSAGLGLL
ncbi:MAG: DoxX family protein [Haloferacaceae archaeon]